MTINRNWCEILYKIWISLIRKMLPPHREHTWHQWPLSHPSGQQLRIPAAEAQITSFLSAFLHTPSQTHSRWAGPLKYTWLQPCPSLTPANPTPPPLGCYNSSTPCLGVLPLAPSTHPQRRHQGDASKILSPSAWFYNTNPSNRGIHALLCPRLFSEYCFWVYETRHREWQQVNLNRCD